MFWQSDESEWHMHYKFWPVVTFPRGEKLSGKLMRRCINGEWQYREPNDSELEQDLQETSW